MPRQEPLFPVFLRLAGCLVVVVGGGRVGRRKAAALHRAGARVRVVCPEPRPDDAGDLDWVTARYDPGHLEGAALVFAAATPEVNARVAADARARGVWVNVATVPEDGDFFLAASLRRGGLVLAVSTGGAAPALARAVRDRLEAEFEETFASWVDLLAEMRSEARARIADAGHRRALFEGWCRWEWLERLRQEGADAVRAALRAELDAG
jgi:precorrin-2 dehydrogenase/sirohydrochlorin ferrochelatase